MLYIKLLISKKNLDISKKDTDLHITYDISHINHRRFILRSDAISQYYFIFQYNWKNKFALSLYENVLIAIIAYQSRPTNTYYHNSILKIHLLRDLKVKK